MKNFFKKNYIVNYKIFIVLTLIILESFIFTHKSGKIIKIDRIDNHAFIKIIDFFERKTMLDRKNDLYIYSNLFGYTFYPNMKIKKLTFILGTKNIENSYQIGFSGGRIYVKKNVFGNPNIKVNFELLMHKLDNINSNHNFITDNLKSADAYSIDIYPEQRPDVLFKYSDVKKYIYDENFHLYDDYNNKKVILQNDGIIFIVSSMIKSGASKTAESYKTIDKMFLYIAGVIN